MKRKIVICFLVLALCCTLLCGCSLILDAMQVSDAEISEYSNAVSDESPEISTEQSESDESAVPVWLPYITIIENGWSDYTVITSKDATAAEQNAAETLAEYFELITGVRLQISTDNKKVRTKEILVGNTSREILASSADLAEEEYLITVEGDRLVFLGGSDRGLLYGVYSFFEENYNCYHFTTDCFTYDTADKVSLSRDFAMQDKPAFDYRESLWACSDTAEWLTWNKLNGGAFSTIGEEYGGSIKYYGFVHTFFNYVSPDDYYKTHPEYFAMVNGKRVKNGQLCLSNSDVLAITIEIVKTKLRENPDCKIVSISQNDGPSKDAGCTCSACKKVLAEEGSYAGSVIRFVNAVADAIKDEFPDVYIDTLAYQYTRSAPAVTVPRDNVIVRLCANENCYNHVVGECDYQTNGDKGVFVKTETTVYDDLVVWSAITSNIYVWDYATNTRHLLATYPNFRVIQQNLQRYYENGVKGVFEQGSNMDDVSCEFGYLRAFLLSKLLWDPYCDLDFYIQKFLTAYYGAAADNVLQYIAVIQEAAGENHIHLHSEPIDMYDLSNETEDYLTALWDEAEALAADDAAALYHVRRSRISYDYYLFLYRYLPGTEFSQTEVVKMRKEFYARLKEFDVTALSNSYYLTDNPNYNKTPDYWRTAIAR